ncbi:MAG: hypothetical protein V2A54_02620 [Bacteroidota bacterium]
MGKFTSRRRRIVRMLSISGFKLRASGNKNSDPEGAGLRECFPFLASSIRHPSSRRRWLARQASISDFGLLTSNFLLSSR